MKENESLRIQGYTTYKVNSTEENNDGTAILIKNNIKHKIDEEYISDILEIIIETDIGEIGITTTYLPPEERFCHFLTFKDWQRNTGQLTLLVTLTHTKKLES